ALFNAHRKMFVRLAAKTQLPTFYPYRVWVDEGGLDLLWTELQGDVSALGRLCGQYPQRREPRKSTDRATDTVRAGGQFQGGKSARRHHPRVDSAARRRGDTVSWRILAVLGCAFWLPHATPAQAQDKIPRIGFLTQCPASFDQQPFTRA